MKYTQFSCRIIYWASWVSGHLLLLFVLENLVELLHSGLEHFRCTLLSTMH